PERLSGVHNYSTTIREDVMKYLCLTYDEEKKVGSMSKSEADAFMGEDYAFTEGIQKSGHYVAGEALQPIQTATAVRIRNGKLSTTDGPCAATKQQLGAFYLIEEALHDAVPAAVGRWPREGVPAKPRAWLVSAGRFKAIDAMRRRARFDASLEEVARRFDVETSDPAARDGESVEDDRLRL